MQCAVAASATGPRDPDALGGAGCGMHRALLCWPSWRCDVTTLYPRMDEDGRRRPLGSTHDGSIIRRLASATTLALLVACRDRRNACPLRAVARSERDGRGALHATRSFPPRFRVHRCAGAGDCRVHALVSHHMCIAVGHDTRHTTSISIWNLSAPCMNVVKIIDMERKDDALRSGDPWPSPWPHLPIGSIVYLPIECTSRVLGAASEGGGRSAMTMGEA